MASNKVWNLMFAGFGWTKDKSDARNPLNRKNALQEAKSIARRNECRVWVEHMNTGERIFQCEHELERFVGLPKQVLVSEYGKGFLYLRLIDEKSNLRRVPLNVKTLLEAKKLAKDNGFAPTHTMSTEDQLLVSLHEW